MNRSVPPGDRGQAFPIYVVVVAGLLFAAFAFFVIAQASVTRSDAQGAADAGALAAAAKARDSLIPGLDLATLKPEDWQKVLDGKLFDAAAACGQARDFAGRNGATATSCSAGVLEFTVAVETTGTVGSSVIPGTEGMHGTANATARIEPRCHLGAAATDASPKPHPGGGGADKPGPVNIECDGSGDIRFDPLHPELWSTLARTLFHVRLVE
ncbi:pilus assembly protein TadG-related protein [Streptomyces sp. G-G2]|uniref:pilus assembly protein TadG-related protein n=1 Tax=Streptomyces sp. G-G2 TaxID=3046201 RepID=UPI0024B9173A|nr:pilus assembly protein TadG-related protein [Streptomyces sp. G-G2]MDJ0384146.1 pilus assembly protein TadG-related protein [Streptomyces sp. G-G2]